MDIAIVKYNAGNIFSVECALRRLGIDPIITDNPDILRRADKVLFPGVGEARAAMDHLRGKGLDQVIRSLTQPVLGICIGQQLMCARSEEGGGTECMGIFDIPVLKFNPESKEIKVPHTGWNTINNLDSGGIIPVDLEDAYVYYVHSYYVPINRYTTAVTDYDIPFSAALHRDNFYSTQFHPEKSGSAGARILKKFIEL